MGRRGKCSAEQFVQIWQSSKDKKEILRRTGYVTATVDKKACSLRKLGIPLQKFKVGRPPGERWISQNDSARIDGLKALAEHYNEDTK